MRSALIHAARRVRHLPPLERADGLWSSARGVYQRVLDPRDRGVPVPVGGGAGMLRVPREFLGARFDTDEPETVRAVVAWLAANPGAEIIDVGCSTGLFSAVALGDAATGRVTAVDPDPPALATCARLCRHLAPERLGLLHAFIDETTDAGETAAALRDRTAATLAARAAAGDETRPRYRFLNDADEGGIPSLALDDLAAPSGPPLLVKVDVEGAELNVLRGASETLRTRRPTLVLSVHDELIRNFGGSPEQVAGFLADHRYGYRVLAVDHEQHWWCEPQPA